MKQIQKLIEASSLLRVELEYYGIDADELLKELKVREEDSHINAEYLVLDLKERIIKKFDKSTYIESGEIDGYIVDIMKEINSYPDIMTEMSCEGHWIEDSGLSFPYFTFLVDRKGWDIFWLECAHKLTTGIELDDTDSKLKRAFYATIKLNDYIDGVIDYCCIGVYGPGFDLCDEHIMDV